MTSPGRGRARATRVIAIAASTGGPQALETILSSLTRGGLPGASRSGSGLAPIVVVQHMSHEFTGAFARRLDALCDLDVREARAGDVLAPDTALIAPGGSHVELVLPRGLPDAPPRVRLHAGPTVHGHRPSADVLFLSVARACGAGALGIVLTGMGCDGAEGLLALRRAGGRTIAESEESCVVFGMPKAARDIGAVETSLPLEGIAPRIRAWAIDAERAGALTSSPAAARRQG